MSQKTVTTLDRSSSILDRTSCQANVPLTEPQALTDQLVSVSIQEGTNLKTAAAMLGAGWVGRATRIGAMTSAPGQTVLAQVIRGGSYVPALAAESAAFAGIERGFHRMEGHPSSQPFQKHWAQSAVTLTGLKLFGGISRGQNIILQHLFTDLGLVGGQHAAHAVHLTDAPHGGFAEQMLQAEATNWHMKGSLTLLHGLSPNFIATERSLDLYLRNQQRTFSQKQDFLRFFPQLAFATAGNSQVAPAALEARPDSSMKNVFQFGSLKGAGGLSEPKPVGEEIVDLMGLAQKGDQGALQELSKKLKHSDPKERFLAALALDLMKEGGKRPVLKKVSKSPDVRIQAVKILGKLGDGEVYSILKEALSDPDSRVRIQIVLTLGQLGEGAAFPILKEALSDPDPRVRIETVLVLEKLNTPASLKAMKKALNDPHESVRGFATALLGYRALGPALKKVSKDSDPRVRAFVAKMLSFLNESVGEGGDGGPSASPSLDRAVPTSISTRPFEIGKFLDFWEQKILSHGEISHPSDFSRWKGQLTGEFPVKQIFPLGILESIGSGIFKRDQDVVRMYWDPRERSVKVEGRYRQHLYFVLILELNREKSFIRDVLLSKDTDPPIGESFLSSLDSALEKS